LKVRGSFQYTCEDLLLKYIAIYKELDPARYAKWQEANSLWLYTVEKHMAERYEHKYSPEDTEEEDLSANLITDSDFILISVCSGSKICWRIWNRI
jgi:hypothetical protein